MSWFEAVRARLHLLFARRAAESRMNEEIGFHIDMETDRLIRQHGIAPDEARRRALVTFGGVTQHGEALREGRGLAWLGGLSLDVKLALRMLVKHPALTLVGVLGMSVAVAIGAVSFSAIYTMIDGTLPISEGDRVIGMRNIDTRSIHDGRATHLHDLVTWREALNTVEELGAYRMVDRNLITADGRSESAHIAEMTASGFRIARVPPLMGRYLRDDDERAGAPSVAVIGYDLWQTRFTARPDIIGLAIQLGDTRYTVIGVMPRGFAFPINNRLWTPLRLNPADYERGSAPGIDVFGRLARGAQIADVRQQATIIGQRLATAYPQSHAHMRTRVVPYTRTVIDNPETIWLYHLVQLLVTMLLVVIGTNVSILVYARTAGRMGEIAIRSALGASRGRVVAQLFAEALALSIVATAVGLLVAHFVLQRIDAALSRIQGDRIPFWMRFHITPGVLLYCAGLAVLAAVIVGVVPALRATSGHVRSSLQQLSSGSSSMRLGGTWRFLIVAQVTVAVAILPVAIAGIAAWTRVESAEAALATKHILTATLLFDRPELARQGTYLNLRTELVNRIVAEPGVAALAFASNPPGGESTTRIEVDGLATSSDTTAAAAGSVVGAARVDLRYFGVFDIPILAGRTFERGDFSAVTTAVIVNRSFVRKLLRGGNPLGRRIRAVVRRDLGNTGAAPSQPWEQIVGVVPDFPVDSSTPEPKVYRPLLPTDAGPVTIALRVNGFAPATYANRLRELTVATNPMLRVESIKPLDQTLYDENAPLRLTLFALELVTVSTLLLSVAGIYALMSFTITRRRREIGIRSALGAGPRRVLMSVLSQVFWQVIMGIGIGIGLAAAIDRGLDGGWTGRRGALVLPAVAAIMLAVGLIAAIGPASRALRIQPTEALKAE